MILVYFIRVSLRMLIKVLYFPLSTSGRQENDGFDVSLFRILMLRMLFLFYFRQETICFLSK